MLSSFALFLRSPLASLVNSDRLSARFLLLFPHFRRRPSRGVLPRLTKILITIPACAHADRCARLTEEEWRRVLATNLDGLAV